MRPPAEPRAHAGRAGPTAGFTLIETLVAVAVMTLLVALVPRAVATGALVGPRAGGWLEARLVAQAVLDDRLTGGDLAPGHVSGRMAGRAWTATLVAEPAPAGAPAGERSVLRVTVTVEAGGGRVYRAETLRIGRAP